MARKRNPFTNITDDFLRKFDKLSPALKRGIAEELEKGSTPYQAVKKVFEKNDLKENLRDWWSACQVGAAEVGLGKDLSFKNDLAARKWFLNQHFQGDKLTLSQRVTRMDFKQDVVSTIQANLAGAQGVTKLSSELSNYSTEEPLRKGIRELITEARYAAGGDMSNFVEFQKILDREKSVALAAMHDGDETVLQRAYMRVVKAAETLNAKGLESVIENAIDKKARSNAFRIAHTEAARAYGIGMRTRIDNDELATGIEWALSSGEGHCDECEELDGKVFAKDDLPEYPLHPYCSCLLMPYYGDEKNLEDHSADVDDSTIPDKLIDYGDEEE